MNVPTFEELEPRIRALPAGVELRREDLLTDAFRLTREGPVEVYFMPSIEASPNARVVVVGITPGWTQMEMAYRVIRRALGEGLTADQARKRADVECAFAGVMRTNLVKMLEQLGVPRFLGVSSADELFGTRSELLCTTSALKHPVFVNGENFTGHSRLVERCGFFEEVVTGILAPHLKAHQDALIIPLGDFVTGVLQRLVNAGALNAERCLLRFPHPSGANGHKWPRFEEGRVGWSRQVAAVLGA